MVYLHKVQLTRPHQLQGTTHNSLYDENTISTATTPTNSCLDAKIISKTQYNKKFRIEYSPEFQNSSSDFKLLTYQAGLKFRPWHATTITNHAKFSLCIRVIIKMASRRFTRLRVVTFRELDKYNGVSYLQFLIAQVHYPKGLIL